MSDKDDLQLYVKVWAPLTIFCRFLDQQTIEKNSANDDAQLLYLMNKKKNTRTQNNTCGKCKILDSLLSVMGNTPPLTDVTTYKCFLHPVWSLSILVLVIFNHSFLQNASSSEVLVGCLACTAGLKSAHRF